jgi:quercetin dioxygenase-like cupin family protein
MTPKKTTTRRNSVLGLVAAAASSQATPPAASLPSATFRFEDLTVRTNRDQTRQRAVFDGVTQSDYPVELHMTELAPGKMPHAAHKHINEELLMLREGTLEVTIEGKVSVIGPGSVIYVAANEMHGWKNTGTTTAHYFVLALGRKRLA